FTARNNSLGASAATRNTSNGIFVSGSTTAGKIENNTIGNSTTGISVPGIGNVLITQNSIFCNSSAGISKSSGPAAPVITMATTQMIKGSTGSPGATIEIFINSTQNCAGAPCQGRSYLGTVTAVGNDWSFDPAGLVSGGD